MKESTDTQTDREKSELERTNRCETISDQTSSEQGEYSVITVKKSDHPSRKRRTVHQLSDEDISAHEKKRNYDLEASVQSLVLQQKETTSDTEKQQDDLKQNQTSPHRHRPRPSNTSPKKGLLRRQQGQETEEETKQATCQTKAKADIKSSSSSEIATTGKQSDPALENLLQTLLKYYSLFQKDEDGDTILHLAIVHKNINLTFAIILAMVRRKQENDKGINIQNKLLQTPLHLAVLTCQPSIVEYLMLHEADVNAIDRNGQTALHLACKNADVEDIHALRKITPKDSEKSINVDLKNFEGLAPIHLATLSGSCEVIEQLLEMGADIDLKDSKSGRTALHHAVEAHNPIVTRFLLLKDANVNAQTFAGNTPLHTASGRRMENIIHILLEFGGDRKLTNFEGDLPIPETYLPYSMIRKLAQKSKEKK